MTARRVFVVVVLGALGAGASLFLIHSARLVTAPYELGYGEGILFWQIGHVLRPAQAYHDVAIYPFVVFHYPPVYHLTVRALEVFGPHVRSAGRLVSLLSSLGVLGALGYLGYQVLPSRAGSAPRWIAAASAAFLGASLDTMYEWVPQARVDMLGLCLTLIGLALFVCAEDQGWKRTLAFCCFVLAVFTKQTFLAAPLACLIIAALRSPAEARRLAAVSALGGGAILAGLEAATSGQFLVHTFGHNENAFSLSRMLSMMGENLRGTGTLVVVALLPVLPETGRSWRVPAAALIQVVDGIRRDAERTRTATVVLYACLAFLVSVTVGKLGSAPNYFLEWNLAASVLGGLTIGATVAEWPRRSAAWCAAVLLLVLAFALPMSLRHVNGTLHLTEGARRLEASRRSEFASALQYVRQAPGPVFSYDMSLLVLSGRDVPLEPAIMWDLARSGSWDAAPFVRQISSQYYSAIVATSDLSDDLAMPGSVRAAIAAAYRPATDIGSYRIYEPRPAVPADGEGDARRH